MNALASVIGKNVSVSLRQPITFTKVPNVAISGISGRCAGIAEGQLLVVEQVTSAHDSSGKDVTNEAKLEGTTVALRVGNIKTLVYDRGVAPQTKRSPYTGPSRVAVADL